MLDNLLELLHRDGKIACGWALWIRFRRRIVGYRFDNQLGFKQVISFVVTLEPAIFNNSLVV